MNRFAVRNWIKRFRPALTTACLLTVIGFSWIIPRQESYFLLQRHLQEIWIVIVGIGAVPFELASFKQPSLVIILVLGIVIGLLIQYGLSGNWVEKVVVLVVLIPNAFIGFCLLAFGFGGGILTRGPTLQCEHINITGEGTRIIRYYQSAGTDGHSLFFFLSTTNRGETWDQIGSASYNNYEVGCSTDRFYGNTNFNYYTCLPEDEARPNWSCLTLNRP